MIRQPTSAAKAYAWHRASIAGQRPPTYEEDIQCGWFRTRFVKNGPWVPIRIWLAREINAEGELACDEEFRAEVDGQPATALYAWQRGCGNPITKQRHDELVRLRAETPAMQATHVPYEPRGAIRP